MLTFQGVILKLQEYSLKVNRVLKLLLTNFPEHNPVLLYLE